MIRVLRYILLLILFGKDSLDGYCSSNHTAQQKKDYIFSSVFPSRDAMERALKDNVAGESHSSNEF